MKEQRKNRSAHCIGDWVGPTAGLDGCEKISPPMGFDPRTVQLVASRYTDYAMTAYNMNTYIHFIIVTDCVLCEVFAEAKDPLIYIERFFNRLSELQDTGARLRKASRPSAASFFLRYRIKRPPSCVLWFIQRPKVVSAFEKCLFKLCSYQYFRKIRMCHAEIMPPEVFWKILRVNDDVQKRYTERWENVQ